MVIMDNITVLMTMTIITNMIMMMIIIINTHQWQGFQHYQDCRDGHTYKIYKIAKGKVKNKFLSSFFYKVKKKMKKGG